MATARDLLDEAARQLQDLQYANWSAVELLQYLNEGLQLLALRIPAQFSKIATVALAAGAKQTLPADGAVILGVRRDVGTNRTPRFVDKTALDAFEPTWQAASAGPTRQWTSDPRHQKTYWVAPPAVNAAQLEIEYAAYPAAIKNNGTVPIDACYHGALVDYILYRALSKDAAYAADDGRASVYYKSFKEKTGGDATDAG